MKKAVALLLSISMVFLVACKGTPDTTSEAEDAKKFPDNYALFLKDGDLFYTDFVLEKPQQLSDALSKEDDDYPLPLPDILDGACFLCNGGKTILYADRVSGGYYTLYRRSTDDLAESASKIDSDLFGSILTDDTRTVIAYCKGDEDALYTYDIATDTRNKIASNIYQFHLSTDGKSLCYLDFEGKFNLLSVGGEAERVDNDVEMLDYVSPDLQTIFYTKGSGLYRAGIGSEKEKIFSEECSVIRGYDNGTVYFLTSIDEGFDLVDFFTDDREESDMALSYPVKPNNSQDSFFSLPSEWHSVKSEDAAWEEYEQAMAEYNSMRTRNEFRVLLAEKKIALTRYSLYYYDGDHAQRITDNLLYFPYPASAKKAPALAYSEQDKKASFHITYDDLYNNLQENQEEETASNMIDALREIILDSITSSAHFCVCKGAERILTDRSNIDSIQFVPDASVVYFTEADKTDLYKMDLSTSEPRAESLDSDVIGYNDIDSDGNVYYFKDVKNGIGDLYKDGKRIDFDVRYDFNEIQARNHNLVYFSDWDSEKEYGTLKRYDGEKVVKVSDDVGEFRILTDGTILYLRDYSTIYGEGTLYAYRDGVSTKIEDDVSSILTPYDHVF